MIERWKFPRERPVSFDYYRDMFLTPPFTIFSILSMMGTD
jgi:hypothetical protein